MLDKTSAFRSVSNAIKKQRIGKLPLVLDYNDQEPKVEQNEYYHYTLCYDYKATVGSVLATQVSRSHFPEA